MVLRRVQSPRVLTPSIVVIEPSRPRRQRGRVDRWPGSLAPGHQLAALDGDDNQPHPVCSEDLRRRVGEDREDAVVRMPVVVVGAHGDDAGTSVDAIVELGALVARAVVGHLHDVDGSERALGHELQLIALAEVAQEEGVEIA